MNKKREIQSSVKDESLIEKRRAQMIRGAVTLFKEKAFTGRRRGKSQKLRDSASALFMNTSGQKKTSSIWSVTRSTMKCM